MISGKPFDEQVALIKRLLDSAGDDVTGYAHRATVNLPDGGTPESIQNLWHLLCLNADRAALNSWAKEPR